MVSRDGRPSLDAGVVSTDRGVQSLGGVLGILRPNPDLVEWDVLFNAGGNFPAVGGHAEYAGWLLVV